MPPRDPCWEIDPGESGRYGGKVYAPTAAAAAAELRRGLVEAGEDPEAVGAEIRPDRVKRLGRERERAMRAMGLREPGVRRGRGQERGRSDG
jgi:hypothetical protein